MAGENLIGRSARGGAGMSGAEPRQGKRKGHDGGGFAQKPSV